MTLDSLRAFWDVRQPRERVWIAAAAIVLALAVLYLALIDPAVSAIARLQHSLPNLRAQSAELQALLAEARSLKSRPAVASSDAQQMQPAVEQSLAGAGLKAARIVPLSSGPLQLTFTDVSYSAWSVWLARAERELGMHAINVTARASAAPGNADIDLALRSGRD
jgi:general secretion pathway protein M